MQRLGHIKGLISISSRSKVYDLQIIINTLNLLLLNKQFVNLSSNNNLIDYIYKRKLYGKGRKHSYLGFKDGTIFSDTYNISNLKIEIQDYYLSNNNLPSNTGSISEGSISEIVDWSTSLGLLKKQKYVQTSLGLLLFKILTSNDIASFSKMSDYNPYIIEKKEKILFLWCLFKYDGDIFLPLLEYIYNNYHYNTFKRVEIGHYLLNVYENAINIYKKNARRSFEIYRLKQLQKVVSSITSQIKKRKLGKKNLGTAELRSTARLEPLVDLGILYKRNSYSYSYNCTDVTFSLLQYINYDIKKLLRNNFFNMINNIYKYNSKKLEDNNEILKNVFIGYYLMRNPLGLSSIEESILIGSINLMYSKNMFFEINEAKNILINMSKIYPKDIRLHIDGLGNVKFFIISNSLLKKYEVI